MEKWIDITNYEGYYQISNFGNVKSLSRNIVRPKYGNFITKEKLLSVNIDKSGYGSVLLVKETKKKKFLVHRLVALHFIHNFNSARAKYVNHINAARNDNNEKNLEWCSQSENKKHSYNLGLSDKKGTKHHNTKFSYNDILKIRELYKQGYTQKKIADIYAVCNATIWNIVNNKTWNYDIETLRKQEKINARINKAFSTT